VDLRGEGENGDEVASEEGGAGRAAAPKSDENQRFPLARYESLWQRSLFHVPVQATVADPTFAREYSLAGIFEMDGRTTAALVRKRDGTVVNVSDGDDAGDRADGLKLIAVETAAGTAGTKVQVEKGGMRAWIVATPVQASAATSRGNSAVAPIPALADRAAADTTEFSDWDSFSGTQTAVSKSELPLQNDGAGSAMPSPVPAPGAEMRGAPEHLVPPAPKVKQPVPVPPSPLDAAMAGDEKEIVVPIEN
jgi:hypothetical protein